jgi:hypothetical protein
MPKEVLRRKMPTLRLPMRQRSLSLVVYATFALSIPISGAADATCAFIKYSVRGRVLAPKGVEPSSIRVYFFLDGARRTSDYPPVSGAVDYWRIDADGLFQGESFYSTYEPDRSKGRKEERCGRVAAAGDLIVVGNGILAERIRVEFERTRGQIRKEMAVEADAGTIPLVSAQTQGEAPPD